MGSLLARVGEAGRVHGSGPAPQILRAGEPEARAATAPCLRPLGGDHINAVVAVLDCAATDVERTWCSANLTGEP